MKKIIYQLLWGVGGIRGVLSFFSAAIPQQTYAQAPSIEGYFNDLSQGENRVFTINALDPNKTLRDNILDLLIPAPLNPSGSTATLRVLIRTIGVGVFLFMIIFFAGQLLIFGSDETRTKNNLRNIGLVILGAFFFFGAVWILSTIITLGDGTSTAEDIVSNINNRLFLQVLAVLKAAAFFMAIIALVVTALRMMSAMDSEEKVTAARKGIVNIVVALLFIKLIDFIYYAVAQPNFSEPIKDLIIQAAVIVGRILGVVMMLAIIVAGYMMIVDGGSGERVKRGRGIIINILLAAVVVFLFLLILYQLVNEF